MFNEKLSSNQSERMRIQEMLDKTNINLSNYQSELHDVENNDIQKLKNLNCDIDKLKREQKYFKESIDKLNIIIDQETNQEMLNSMFRM